MIYIIDKSKNSDLVGRFGGDSSLPVCGPRASTYLIPCMVDIYPKSGTCVQFSITLYYKNFLGKNSVILNIPINY